MQTNYSFYLTFSQSLDYEICDNELYQNDTKFRESNSGSHKDIARWILFILIGKQYFSCQIL